MKNYYFLLCSILLFSCRQEKSNNQIPDALNDNKVSVSGSFRSYDDENLVDKLYAELIKNDQELQKFDSEILNNLNKSHEVRKELFSYDDKSKNYYSSVVSNTKSITDSLLKKKLIELLKNSESKYYMRVSNLKKMSGIIEKNNASISDNYTFFKTALTIPIIEKFQKENLPNAKPLESFIAEQIEIKNKIESNNK
ncbi:hypothetical protein J4771_01190 [Candidatus Kaistella beijingensis]|uniref:hypothetical protein n=1 Tax=Candidatus Kaistella beijingensis TaxID=2820270 RepID=UPI001CC7DB45|nr:hypothetical protein [Candidatus Kaistella beijingensis]UBB89996.1 hypothetical protein J4771_01190 [Candidatus Kaistella beijingensis]